MNDSASDTPLTFNMKKAAFFVLAAILFILLAALCSTYFHFSDRVITALIALSISIILYGLLESTAKVTLTEIYGVNLGKGISLTGAIGGFVTVFFIINGQDNVEQPKPMASFDIVFHSPLYLTNRDHLFDKEKLVITQLEPINSSLSDYPIVPLENIGSEWGKYKVIDRKLDTQGEKMHLVAKRKVTASFPGPVSTIPTFNICFQRLNAEKITAELECQSSTCALLTDKSSNITTCESDLADIAKTRLSFFSHAYAQEPNDGWITPSIATLEEMNAKKNATYVYFEVSTPDLILPNSVNNFTYALSVNSAPIYLNGWQENETRTKVVPSSPFVFQFGLQNLDFSGKNYGEEDIQLIFKFYSDNELVETHRISRKYIALRHVHSTDVMTKSGVQYTWSGKQYFGTSDGYEVFIWSSEKPDELVDRRKLFFDDEDIFYNQQEVVAVIRPPLNDNDDWGLAVGLKDNYGRVQFTFPEETAGELLAWANHELLGKRTKHRPETGFDHPLIKAPYIYEIRGH